MNQHEQVTRAVLAHYHEIIPDNAKDWHVHVRVAAGLVQVLGQRRADALLSRRRKVRVSQ